MTKKKCKICGLEFECYNKGKSARSHRLGTNRSVSYKRPSDSVTCSKKCSRLYVRKRR